MIIEQISHYCDSIGAIYSDFDPTGIEVDVQMMEEIHFRRLKLLTQHNLLRNMVFIEEGHHPRKKQTMRIWFMGTRPEWDRIFAGLQKVALRRSLDAGSKS